MTLPKTVLKTKIVPVRIKPNLLRKPSLFKKLKGIHQYPLTLLHSGPGYGKSTSLSSYLQQSKEPFCWYSIGEQESDLPTFVLYLIHAIRTQYPDFAQADWTHLMPKDGYWRDEDVRTLWMHWMNELVGLEQPVILVLDDFHIVESVKEIRDWMELTMEHLPSTLHLVLSSRTRPPWEILTRLKVKGELLEITEQDLALTEEEVEVLFEDTYEYPLSPFQIKRIFQLTEGWIIAIQMIWQQLLTEGPLELGESATEGSTEDLFRFLASEVLAKQTPEVQQFLTYTAILDELNAGICEAVFGFAGAEEKLKQLSQKNLFLTYLGEKQYRYHALFKDFLLQQLRFNHELYHDLERRAADYYAQMEMTDQALSHYLQARDEKSLAQYTAQIGRRYIEAGKLDRMNDVLQTLTAESKDEHPRLWLYQGDILRYRCYYEQSLEAYRRAEALAVASSDVEQQSEALEGQARVYLDTIQPRTADEYLQRAIHTLEHVSDSSVEQEARLLLLIAENRLNLGHANEGYTAYERSRALRPELPRSIELEARLYLRTGKLDEAISLLERHRKLEVDKQERRLPRSHRETDIVLSLLYSFIGDRDKAKSLAQGSVMQGVEVKAPFVEACGWIRLGHAAQLFSHYGREMPLECYETALSIMDEIHVSRGKAEPLMGLSLLYGRENHLERAKHFGQLALQETERVDDVWLSSFIRLSMAISYVYSHRGEEAALLLEQCVGVFEEIGDRYGWTVSRVWLAYVYWQQERPEWTEVLTGVIQHVEAAYPFLFRVKTFFGPRDVQQWVSLLLHALNEGVDREELQRYISSLGLSDITSHPGYTLRIQSLGSFRVWLGDTELEEKDWQRGKAKELFQLLFTRKGQTIPREEIYSALWPDSDDDAATRDFKVALNALNKALEPHRAARSAPYFVQRYGTSYGLQVEFGVELDASLFEEAIREGLEADNEIVARQLLSKGLEIYKGDYLLEEKEADWCREERERLIGLYLRGAEKKARLLLNLGDIDGAIHWCERILDRDACWEEAYRLLMDAYYQKNNRTQALRWYQRCCDRLQRSRVLLPAPL